ncbi:hypothetical protein INT44_004813, partial [Umbelopsis vinacea]
MSSEEVPNNVDQIPSEQKGAFHSFLKSLASFSGDLSALTCPAFLLAPNSLIEYSEYWVNRPDLFTAIPQIDDEQQRMLAVLKWFISSLNGSYSSRVPKGEWEKKPYNPVLGEQYFMTWGAVGNSGETDVVCEQVSHHPPITGFHLQNDTAGVSVNGHNGQKTRFSGTSLIVDQVGHGVIKLKTRGDESYLFTLPSLTVNGIWYAAPYLELTGSTYIQSSTGFYVTIDYTSKGWLSGAKNSFKAYLRKNSGSPKEYICKVEGQWTGKSTLTPYGIKGGIPFLDVTDGVRPPMQIKPIEEQGEWESRRIWQKVSDAILEGDVTKASEEKTKIENKQRAEKKERDEANQQWQPQYFTWVEQDPVYSALEQMATKVIKSKHTDVSPGGSWIYKKDASQ